MTPNRRQPACTLLVLLFGSVAASAQSPGGFDIVKDGKPTAVIVLAETAENPLVVSDAGRELQYHVEKASGARLPVVKESELVSLKPMPTGRIYLGPCSAAREAGIDVSGLPNDSFVILTAGNALFIVGKDAGTGRTINDMAGMARGTVFGVYEFLERQMGVRWLWPGELGEVVPAARDIHSGAWKTTVRPRHVQLAWSFGSPYGGEAWSRGVQYNYDVAVLTWMRRHRLARSFTLDYGEAFQQNNGDYWRRFGRTHPEFFNRLPDGTRRPDPARAFHFAMCESEPGLWRQIVDDWRAKRAGQPGPWVNCTPNDTSNLCTCERCLAWDEPAAGPEALALARKEFSAGKRDWANHLGSLSDRHARYLLAVQKEAEKHDPKAVVTSYAYENYSRPPVKTRLNDRVVLSLAPYLSFPYDEETSREFLAMWNGWAATGARLILRPNVTYGTHNMPSHYARRVGEDIRYAMNHSAIGTWFDSLTGMWAAQGPSLYVVSRVQRRPDLPVEAILDEYYQAFGPAAPAVRAYFDHWEQVTAKMTRAGYSKLVEEYDRREPDSLNFRTFIKAAHLVYTPQAIARGRAILEAAGAAARGHLLAEKRVAFLKKGLRDAELTLETQAALAACHDKKDWSPFARALARLDAQRRENETSWAVDLAYVRMQENISGWDRARLAGSRGPGEPER